MKSTDKPSLIETVIASGAKKSYVRTIPKTQTESGNGEMSLDLGWPPECAIPVAAGGKYPQMADANGVLNLLSAAVQQLQARFFGPYNADFAAAIGGYPLNAIVSDTTAGKFWVSTAEDNTTAPGSDGASWQDLFNGYATQAWANSTFVKNNAGTKGGVVALDLDSDGSGRVTFEKTDGSWGALQPAGDYATNTALNHGLASKQPLLGYTPVQQGTGINQGTNVVKIGWGNGPHKGRIAVTVDKTDVGALANVNDISNLQNQINNRVLKTGDSMTGHLRNTDWISAGANGGWNGARANTGDYGWTNGLDFGNPANDGKYRGTWTVTDVLNDGGSNSSGLNLTGYDAAGKTYQWYFAWNGKVTTPGGVLAFESDLSGYVANTNPGISGALAGTSLCVNPSDGRSYLAYSGNTKIASLAWYSDVTAEATARTNADNNLQAQISAKMDSSFAASGIIAAGGAAGNGTIVGGTWMRVGNTLTQTFTVENISSGTVTFPVAFSGSDDQVTCIFQTADGSANTFRPGQITTKSATFHSPGGGGASRMTVQAQGPYGT